MSERPRVSAVIVSYNRAADLRLAIEGLLAARYAPLEIIVVDNASTDGSADVAAGMPLVRVVRNARNEGFAQGNNIGLRLATGAYVALVNNDAVVAPDWIERLAAFLEAHPEAAAAGGKQYVWDEAHPPGRRGGPYHGPIVVDPTSGYVHVEKDAPDRVREVCTLSGAVVMIRRAAVEAIGAPFLEPLFFTYYEETDFFARAIRRGWRLYYTGEPAAWHRIRASGTSYHFAFHMERNRVLFAYRNFSARGVRGALAASAARAALTLLNPISLARAVLPGAGDPVFAGRRDAWRWLLSNRHLLREARAAALDGGPPYDEVVAAIRARARAPEEGR